MKYILLFIYKFEIYFLPCRCYHLDGNFHKNHDDHGEVGGVMDEGTIGRNAAAMRENVSHILTKVASIIIINIITIVTSIKERNSWL